MNSAIHAGTEGSPRVKWTTADPNLLLYSTRNKLGVGMNAITLPLKKRDEALALYCARDAKVKDEVVQAVAILTAEEAGREQNPVECRVCNGAIPEDL